MGQNDNGGKTGHIHAGKSIAIGFGTVRQVDHNWLWLWPAVVVTLDKTTKKKTHAAVVACDKKAKQKRLRPS